MNDAVITQTSSERTVIDTFDKEFARLHARSCRLIEKTPVEILYQTLRAPNGNGLSVGEFVLKSAGLVEQTFGGITSNLWDNPFEWTLPETLSTTAHLMEYLGEVEDTRKHAFACFSEDADLLKKIVAPSGDMHRLINLLLCTLLQSVVFQGRAITLLATLSNPSNSGSTM